MGFRFRKSFGKGPFRVTMSKSGIGYSVGGKGARFTKKAGGGTRSTLSIPGTGISYVTDSKKNTKVSVNNMIKKPEVDMDTIPVPQNWITNRLGLTPSESKLFVTAMNTFGEKAFTSRDIAAAGCPVSSSIYTGLYNKNVLNKNEDKTWSLNVPYINKVGEEYKMTQMPKGHSAILHLIFGGFLLYIPTIYYLCSKKHYFHW